MSSETKNDPDDGKTYEELVGKLRNRFEVRIFVARYEKDVTSGHVIEGLTAGAYQAVYEFRKAIDWNSYK